MGSQAAIDLIGSLVVFGWLMLMALGANTANSENVRTAHADLLVQENLVTLTQVMEYDFRKIGFCLEPHRIPDPTRAVVEADSTRVTFLSDVDLGSGPDGHVDTVRYLLGPASELTGTPNPRDRLLYRLVNGETPRRVNLGVTEFKLAYFDRTNTQIPSPVTGADLQRIVSIQVTLSVENVMGNEVVETAPINRQYVSAFWQQRRLSSRNYRNR